jgi:hypothetical protein
MKKLIILIVSIILLVLVYVSLNNNVVVEQENLKPDIQIKNINDTHTIEQESFITEEIQQHQEAVDKVISITGWDESIAELFIQEAKLRDISVFEEALPIVAVETGKTYKSDMININANETTDQGLFQINDITMIDIIPVLKAERREFDNWDRLNPEFNIVAGMYYLSYLKNTYDLEWHQLFTSYNRGVKGGMKYADRNGTYESSYSRAVVSKVEKFLIEY